MIKRRWISTAILIAVLLPGMGCIRQEAYIPLAKDRLKGSGKLYLIPLGDFHQHTVNELASFYRDKYSVEVQTLPSVPLPETAIDPERHQLIAEEAIEVIMLATPELKNDSKAIVIGLTDQDMYIAKYDWRFSFSYRERGKYAVVASGRMHLPNGNRNVTEELILKRLRKMVTKNVGILYYGLPQSDDPRSVLYRNVGGIRELDYMGEEF